ncbi:MAG: succinylglutamate desuccinylase/aspartoacylase family protein [Planctomycetota bacterium]
MSDGQGEKKSPAGLPPREIDRFEGLGPVLFCVGGLHGNEPGGVEALTRVCAQLRRDREVLAGTLVALRGNRPALQVGERGIDRDLNRVWHAEDIARVLAQDAKADRLSDMELRGLHGAIAPFFGSGRPLFLLDLHSTSGGGPPFAVVLGAEDSQRLGAHIGVPCVHGLNESIQGTLAAWFSEFHGAAIVVEGGKSGEPSTVRHLEAAVWSALAITGLLPDDHNVVRHARQILRQETDELPGHVNVFHREETAGSRFVMGSLPSRRFQSFDAVRQGDRLGDKDGQPVFASRDGYLVMPLYQDQGGEGFFLAEACGDPAAKVPR